MLQSVAFSFDRKLQPKEIRKLHTMLDQQLPKSFNDWGCKPLDEDSILLFEDGSCEIAVETDAVSSVSRLCIRATESYAKPSINLLIKNITVIIRNFIFDFNNDATGSNK